MASLVWDRFGDTPNYVEPFFGSGAVLLSRPRWPWEGNRIETVNDADGMISNFWRALQAVPDEVAQWADWPVNECDLHARHLWLVTEGKQHVERLKTEPDYFDAKIAGWWVWGICQWIGSGWCLGKSSWGKPFADGRLAHEKLPHLGNAGHGIHRPSQQLQHFPNAGMGINRPHQKRPHLGDAGRGVHRAQQDLYGYFVLLADRIRGVRVCCGDWSRICGPTPTFKQGLTGVFLDPPYSLSERDKALYSVESDCAVDVRKWCLENGNNKLLRIALCGYVGEGHEELETKGWDVVHWKARGGYASQGGSDVNAKRERIWFSPNCLRASQPGLFDLVS